VKIDQAYGEMTKEWKWSVKRNDEPESQLNTDPFLYKVDIVAVLIEA
jgi:hypothetical protein